MNEQKKKLRIDTLARLAKMSAQDKAGYDRVILGHVYSLIRQCDARTIGIMWPFQSEPDIRTVADEPDLSIYLPVVHGSNLAMSFRRWHIGDPMRHGLQGTVEPASGDETQTLDLAFVPFVVMDWSGGRIGRGKGYYDATLPVLRANNPAFKAFGIGYGLQISQADLPRESHDVALNGFITENGCFECG